MTKTKRQALAYWGNPYNMKVRFKELKTRLRPVKKFAFKCNGGAIDGHVLYMSSAGTMPFTLNGVKGYYDSQMKWVQL